jgi:DNA helicase-2/ATP-dependent DNA helicase PcrA
VADRAQLDRLDELAHDLELLAAETEESVQDVRVVPWPVRMSATSAMDLSKDRAEFARRLARPMPRRPSPAARFGTRFHAWIEDHYGMTGLFDPTDLPGRGDAGIDSDAELDRLKEMFLASEFASRTPEQIEAPFSLVLGGQQFIGRIDAVFGTTDDAGTRRYEVVDWKTNAQPDADPLQLAIYRLAWAELTGSDLAHVTGAFYYARLGETVRYGPDDLLDRAGLEQAMGLHALR